MPIPKLVNSHDRAPRRGLLGYLYSLNEKLLGFFVYEPVKFCLKTYARRCNFIHVGPISNHIKMKRNREILYLTTKVNNYNYKNIIFMRRHVFVHPDTFLHNDEETKIFHWIVNFCIF